MYKERKKEEQDYFHQLSACEELRCYNCHYISKEMADSWLIKASTNNAIHFQTCS